jgi:hypothetical protein
MRCKVKTLSRPSAFLSHYRHGICASLGPLGRVRPGTPSILHGTCHGDLPRQQAKGRRHASYDESILTYAMGSCLAKLKNVVECTQTEQTASSLTLNGSLRNSQGDSEINIPSPTV